MTFALRRRAIKHYPRYLPHAARNRAHWLRAVQVLRTETQRGWVLDGIVTKREAR